MTTRNYELRLEGIPSPPGQIPLRDLAEIASALQLAATRIARQVVGAERPGRAPAFVDRLSEIRLTGLAEGSTVLELSVGDEQSLPMPGGDGDVLTERLEQSFAAIARSSPPEWASPLVRESIGRFVARVDAAGADRVVASWGANGTRRQQVIALGDLDPSVWVVDEDQETEQVTMAGLLDKVDLRARRFRIHDDVGHDIILEDVVDVDSAARLIGQRVTASGTAERNGERVARIIEPTLTAERLPDEWLAQLTYEIPLGESVPKGGIAGVSGDEVDQFLAEIRG